MDLLDDADPPTLSFATNIGSTSSPQSVTVENIGSATLSAIPPGLTICPNFAQVAGSGTRRLQRRLLADPRR